MYTLEKLSDIKIGDSIYIITQTDDTFEVNDNALYKIVWILENGVLVEYDDQFSIVTCKYVYRKSDNEKTQTDVKVLLNVESGVSHVYLNEKPICGIRGGKTLVESNQVTCKSCLKVA